MQALRILCCPVWKCVLLYGSRFAEVFRTVGLTAAGETVKFRITVYLGYFIIQPVASQHTKMAVVISSATACGLASHNDSP